MEQSIRRSAWLLVGLMAVALLPWLGLTDFNTKGEPREAIVAQTMMEQANWILPHNNGGEMAYKPPFFHWCVAAVSSVAGEVGTYTSRLPSALACMAMVLWTFLFVARRRDVTVALVTALVTLTSFEVWRAAFACRVDMVLTFCIVGAMLALYRWSERPRRGVPWLAILMMSLGTLTKGPVAILLPCGVMGLFLLVQRECFFRVFFSLCGAAVASLVLPALWYWAAYQQGGEAFLQLVMEENVGRFLGKMTYASHENGVWYYFAMLPAGLLPWTLVLVPALWRRWSTLGLVRRVTSMDRFELFMALAAVVVFVFYCIPKSKRGVYILPMYPFVGYFVAVCLRRRWSERVLNWMLRVVVAVWTVVFAVVLPLVLNKKSDWAVALEIERKVGDAHLTSYIANSVKGNPMHFFTIDFYLHDRVGVWSEEGPAVEEGLVIVGEKDAPDFIAQRTEYEFSEVELTPHRSCDTHQTLRLYRYKRSITK
ncbi:MAG: glycosyltransferase family 39 protein [Bacteroidaceae bacterium]|nr:glycosyltransferase family 39 protein [Bacteroidaceae bacterium]